MPRTARVAPGGVVYHVFNRSVGRMQMFRKDADFEAFQRVMMQAHQRFPLRLLAWCIMPDHWRFVPRPQQDGQLTDFFRWLAHTHAMRWRVSHHTVGYGHLYQDRFRSFPVQPGESTLTIVRHVERSALSAGLVTRAENWCWSSLWTRLHGTDQMRALLASWPVAPPGNWIERVNAPFSDTEIQRINLSLRRGRPFGSDAWTARIVRRLHLQHTLRREGRPAKRKRDGRG